MITRRSLLAGMAAAGAGLAVPLRYAEMAKAVVPPGWTPFTETLPRPPVLPVSGTASLSMESTTHSFFTGSSTTAFAFQSGASQPTYLGPTLVAQRGVPVTVTIKNNLGAHPVAAAIDTGIPGAVEGDKTAPRTAVHLHGGYTEAVSDGLPHQVFAHGEERQFNYGNEQEAANLWYHDHALGITRLNVYAGLAGGYLIRDNNDDGTGDRLPAGEYEIPLILQDRMFDATGQLIYPTNPTPAIQPDPKITNGVWAPEFFGDVPTVNGKAWPNLDVKKGKYRFRVYNGSQSRFYDLKLLDPAGIAVAFQQIGTDCGLLNAPVGLKSLVLGPGERADLIIDFTAFAPGTKLTFKNNARTPYPNGPRSARKGGVALPSIMQFTVQNAPGWTGTVPTNLRANTANIPRLTAADVNGGVVNMALLEQLDAVGVPIRMLVNDRNFEGSPTGSGHPLNKLQRWNLINLTVDAHPMHLHLTQYQVLQRQAFDVAAYKAKFYPGYAVLPTQNAGAGAEPGDPTPYLKGKPRPPAANEAGWKDTAVVLPGEVTSILVPFGPDAVPNKRMAMDATDAAGNTLTPHQGTYSWHCHILEHEENDMMQHFTVQ